MLQQTEKWHTDRVGKITGTKPAVILEKNPWQKPDDLIRSMVREYHFYVNDNQDAAPEFTGNVATQWGNDHEQDARKLHQFECDIKVVGTGFIPHPKYDWIGCSPDGLIGDDGIAEYKCPYSQKIPDKPDDHYEIQCQFNMWVTGRKWCDLFYWTPEKSKRFRINYDPDFIAFNFPFIEAFYHRYLSELDNTDHLQPLVSERTDAEYVNAAQLYRIAKNALQEAQDAEKNARQTLIDLADGKACKGQGVTVTPYQRAGNVQYKKIPQLEGVNLDDYRAKASTQYRVTVA